MGQFMKMIFEKSIEINFCVSKNGQQIVGVPVLVLVLLIAFFWPTLPIIIVALFFGFNYSFTGSDKVVADANNVCDKVSQTAESIKNEFKKDEEQN